MFRRCSRGWSVLLCCAWLWPSAAAAREPIFQDGNFVPYVELPASQSAVTRGLERRVMVFLHFNCPYCRGIHPALRQWSRNLPPGPGSLIWAGKSRARGCRFHSDTGTW